MIFMFQSHTWDTFLFKVNVSRSVFVLTIGFNLILEILFFSSVDASLSGSVLTLFQSHTWDTFLFKKKRLHSESKTSMFQSHTWDTFLFKRIPCGSPDNSREVSISYLRYFSFQGHRAQPTPERKRYQFQSHTWDTFLFKQTAINGTIIAINVSISYLRYFSFQGRVVLSVFILLPRFNLILEILFFSRKCSIPTWPPYPEVSISYLRYFSFQADYVKYLVDNIKGIVSISYLRFFSFQAHHRRNGTDCKTLFQSHTWDTFLFKFMNRCEFRFNW